jgi:hypothetical protein
MTNLVEGTRHPQPGLWLGRIGAWLSLILLGVSLGALAEVHPAMCTGRAGANGSVDLTPVLFFLVAAVALLVDVRAMRRGGTPRLVGPPRVDGDQLGGGVRNLGRD